jgi:Holliday junction DNA helicase RuvA
MIASIRGIVQSVEDDQIVVEIGGVGLHIAIPTPTGGAIPEIGRPIFLHTKLIVREDALNLYGFDTLEKRNLFELLLEVSGVGPRLALSILSYLSPELIRSAVVNGQPEALVVVPGIGKKTAERIIFHMRDKLEPSTAEFDIRVEADTEVVGVLTALGYSVSEAQAAVRSIPDETSEEVEERVRLALKYFAH